MTSDFLDGPTDSTSHDRLAANGLRLELIDAADVDQLRPWLHADARGFHEAAPDQAELERMAHGTGYRRSTGVWDDSLADAAVPVATISSWPAELTVSDDRTVHAWAISSVTVSPTHRRRGIARALLESELRTAVALGHPVAMLTVSEATIYGRYGFAPAAMAATWSIDVARTTWTGPAAGGRVQFITAEMLRSEGPGIFERARVGTPGDVTRWDALWGRFTELGSAEKAARLRIVRYDDADGIAQGFAIYVIEDNDGSVRTRAVNVRQLTATTDDASAGLWRFLLEQDLVGEMTAPLRRVDEPIGWQLSNPRAARKTDEKDHLWVRVLDPIAALSARRYRAAGRFVLDVTDPLGFASGRFVLDVGVDGLAQVTDVAADGSAGVDLDGAPSLRLSVTELGALYLGGTAAQELLRAGRLVELAPGSADAVDDAFRAPVAPWLSIVF